VARDAEQESRPVIIKKYANRRLYNTDTSTYVTLEDLAEMVRGVRDFVVYDAKSGEDLTHAVLTQIIVEQESRGTNLLPIGFLRQLIRFYGDSMQGFLPPYLEMSMESFSKSQEQMREQFQRAFGGKTPIAAFEETAQRNMALFQQALSMWSPYAVKPATRSDGEAPENVASEEAGQLADLKKQLETMQRQLDAMAPPPRKPGA
jgi:polyhydroxyalkanoate synthesis repressor PhaR